MDDDGTRDGNGSTEPDAPEQPDEPTRSRDGADNVTQLPGRTGKPLEEGAEDEEPEAPEPPAIEGDHQLSLAGLGSRRLPVTSEVSFMGKSEKLEGMFKPEQEVTFVIRCRVNKYEYTPERNGNEVVGFKHTHQMRVMGVAKAGTDHAKAMLEMAAPEAKAS